MTLQGESAIVSAARAVGWLPSAPRGLAGGCALLAVATLLTLLIAGSIGFALYGMWGLLAASLAAVLCLSGAEAALVASRLAQRAKPDQALTGMLLAMLFRMAAPLAGALWIYLQGDRLVAAGAWYQLIVFYLVTLAVEVGLQLQGLPAPRLAPRR